MSLYAELKSIEGVADFNPPGVVPADWGAVRRLGTAVVRGDYADVGHSTWISAIRSHLAPEVLQAGFTDFDAHALYTTARRTLTQHISRLIYDNRLDGIRYLSKHGSDAECWALFEQRALDRR